MTFRAGLWTGAACGGLAYALTLNGETAVAVGCACTLVMWAGAGLLTVAVNGWRKL